MPFPMKIQPIDPNGAIRAADHAKPAPKSRLKRLFERQFPGVLRNSSAERLPGAGDGRERDRDGFDHEPSSVCLDKMVRSFMEDTEKPSRCGRSRCNCFHGTCDEVIKGLAVCTSVAERNLLADVSSIAEKHKSCRRKDELRRLVTDGLRSAGYDAAVCRSRWDKTPSFPAGEYEYVDVVVRGGAGEERLIVDVDFRSEFEIARSTKSYRAVLQSLPSIFVGKGDRLQQIVAVASEAAKMSLRKKGLHFPPWRNPEYMRSKWLSPFDRTYCTTPPSSPPTSPPPPPPPPPQQQQHQQQPQPPLIIEAEEEGDDEEEHATAPWEPPEVKPKEEAARRGAKVVTGLASVLRDIP
ncbi:uncharacterized protein LOC109721791 [Ananas comosus]|uniref:Uncharacterized protein LOC109721791 n=1 Tax=Ananas comosus TaxID=4615 RepID=A0A6P5GBJ2_ANACO|nr:uncharacterized protein LOC109721791 [Ananas comosus]XP_020105168.1 uncharacterized protein LOC109721791 [Ananas comosus]